MANQRKEYNVESAFAVTDNTGISAFRSFV